MLAKIDATKFGNACQRAIDYLAAQQREAMPSSLSAAEATVVYGKKIKKCTQMRNLCRATRATSVQHVEVSAEEFALVSPWYKDAEDVT